MDRNEIPFYTSLITGYVLVVVMGVYGIVVLLGWLYLLGIVVVVVIPFGIVYGVLRHKVEE